MGIGAGAFFAPGAEVDFPSELNASRKEGSCRDCVERVHPIKKINDDPTREN